ncbi:glutamate-rich protein 1 isoform X2 [Hyla sarda]|uniref:glutamate-rich protein 1 isoform X2 n=1 Tax=Hyla sarda TaxID=327740 RepID=UPI0024C3DD97|nr:glutamate-rich protein 1 isoform X2 [Hyla sarda]
MSSARKEVFLSKVLTRLYPSTADLHSVLSKNETLPTGTEEKPKEAIQPTITEPAGIEKSNLSQLKIYTVSLPLEDYIPPPQTDLKLSSSEDSEQEEDHPVAVSKRRRRKKKRLNFTNEATLESELNLQQTPHPSQASNSVKINKNKKRKLQRKRQKERLKAEGLWNKGRTCQSDVSQTEGNAVRESGEQTEEDRRKKTEDLLDFLQATQELYFSDSQSRCADSTLMGEQILEILDQIKSGAVPFSEVQLLHNLKSLLLLQDIGRLNNSLDSFKEQSSMPLERKHKENKIITSQAAGPEVTPIAAAFRRRTFDFLAKN